MKMCKYSFLAALLMVSAGCYAMKKQPKLNLDDFKVVVSKDTIMLEHDNAPLGDNRLCITCYDKKNQDVVVADAHIHMYDMLQPQDGLEKFHKTQSGYKYVFEKYDSKFEPMAKLQKLKIVSHELKGRGLGTQLFERAVQELRLCMPKAVVMFWSAYPLDGEQLTDDLIRFYRNRGAIHVSQEILQTIDSSMDKIDIFLIRKNAESMNDIFYLDLMKNK